MFGRRAGVVRRRPLLRAAVVGGGAYMAGKASARRQDDAAAQDAGQDQRINDLEQQQSQAAPVPSQRPADAGSPLLEQLDRLTALHQQGALSDDEFAAAKSKLLGS
ncbi:MAG TPA: SHOCT domain-containing protein [Trebonia sp.]|jgi:hypothetical protein|nr:SHOCT domain-containing protein [Trebonia sp.]